MAYRHWTRTRLIENLKELRHLLARAERESRGSPDDIAAQRLLQQLIERRRAQLRSMCRCQPRLPS